MGQEDYSTSKTSMQFGEAPVFQDVFVREVRINYVSTDRAVFKIAAPSDVADFVRSVLPDNSREHCVALYLSASHCVVSYSVVSTGSANSASIHPREVFQRAITSGAIAIVISHNHPSGNSAPSDADEKFTRGLKEAGRVLGIPLLDHVIITDDSNFSFEEQGRL